jgi:uncharacterized membrane protein
MERNGLDDRYRERRIGMWICGVSLFFLISFFLVPYMLPESSVPQLSGRANAIDYSTTASWGNQAHTGEMGHDQPTEGLFAWTELDGFSAFIYAFGDLNCHQKNERSWQINGNQMPVCTRDIGIFFGLALGGFVFSRRGLNRWTVRDSMLSIFPDDRLEYVYRKNLRTKAVLLIAAITVIPLAIDGFTQMLTSYESTNIMRIITGLPFGALISLYLAASFSSRPAFFEGVESRVILPSNASFSSAKTEQE